MGMYFVQIYINCPKTYLSLVWRAILSTCKYTMYTHNISVLQIPPAVQITTQPYMFHSSTPVKSRGPNMNYQNVPTKVLQTRLLNR